MSGRVGADINGHEQKPDSSNIIVLIWTMTSRNITEIAMELDKCKANLHPSFGGIQFCSVNMVAVLTFYMENDF